MVESVAEMTGKRKSISQNQTETVSKKVKSEPNTPIKQEKINTPNKKDKLKTPKQTPASAKKSPNKTPFTPKLEKVKQENVNSPTNGKEGKQHKRGLQVFLKEATSGKIDPETALSKIETIVNNMNNNKNKSPSANKKLNKLLQIAKRIQESSGIQKINVDKLKKSKSPQTTPNKKDAKNKKQKVEIKKEPKEEDSEDDEDEDDVSTDEGEEDSDEEIKVHTPKIRVERNTDLTIFVGNLSYKTKPMELNEFFSSIGKVDDVRMPRDGQGRKKGFAYVQFADEAAYKKALSMNKATFQDRKINVEKCKFGAEAKKADNEGKPKSVKKNKQKKSAK